MNSFITPDWFSMEMLKLMTKDFGGKVGEVVRVRLPKRFQPTAPPPVVIPPSVLVAGLAVAVAAKVPFSRRRLLMPWKVDEPC